MNIPSQLPSEPNARDALFALDAACERTAWVRILMGAKAAGLSLDDVTNWSSTGSNYLGPLDVARTWNSIASASGIGEGTLYFLAREAGWRPPLKARPDAMQDRQENEADQDHGLQKYCDHRRPCKKLEKAVIIGAIALMILVKCNDAVTCCDDIDRHLGVVDQRNATV